MKKKDIIKALEPFADEDELTMDDNPFLGEFSRICGRGQYATNVTINNSMVDGLAIDDTENKCLKLTISTMSGTEPIGYNP